MRFDIYDAEYLLITVPLPREEGSRVIPALRSGTFGIVDDRAEFALAKRGHPTTKNAAILRRLGG